VVVRRRAGADVDDEDDGVGLGDRLLGLARHLLDDAGRVLGLEAAGVDDDELVAADDRVAVVAIAGQPGEVGDDRVARLRHAVEERRLADVGAADEGDDGLHRRAGRGDQPGRNANTPPFRVTTTRTPPTLTGGVVIALPSVATRACDSPLARENQCSIPFESP
jgi:hypothetical protein